MVSTDEVLQVCVIHVCGRVRFEHYISNKFFCRGHAIQKLHLDDAASHLGLVINVGKETIEAPWTVTGLTHTDTHTHI